MRVIFESWFVENKLNIVFFFFVHVHVYERLASFCSHFCLEHFVKC